MVYSRLLPCTQGAAAPTVFHVFLQQFSLKIEAVCFWSSRDKYGLEAWAFERKHSRVMQTTGYLKIWTKCT